MKVKCKADVQDKNTGNWYVANKEYDLPKERAEEVVKAYNGRYFEFVEDVEEVKELKLVSKEVEIKLEEVEEPKKTTKKATKKSAK